MTIGELREAIEGKPDDAEVFYERTEDSYFESHEIELANGKTMTTPWKVKLMPGDGSEPDQYIRTWGAVQYREDPNLYITAHY